MTVVAHHHLAGAQRGQQRDVTWQHAQVAGHAGRDDEIRLLAEDASLGSDQLDLQLRHRCYSLFSLARSTASSMPPHM